MNLRCKTGDMAFDMNPRGQHYGQICTVGVFVGNILTRDQGEISDAWRISFKEGDYGLWVETDSMLLPIKPGLLDDESHSEAASVNSSSI